MGVGCQLYRFSIETTASRKAKKIKEMLFFFANWKKVRTFATPKMSKKWREHFNHHAEKESISTVFARECPPTTEGKFWLHAAEKAEKNWAYPTSDNHYSAMFPHIGAKHVFTHPAKWGHHSSDCRIDSLQREKEVLNISTSFFSPQQTRRRQPTQ